MPSIRSTKAKRASATPPAELRSPRPAPRNGDPEAAEPAAAPSGNTDEATGRPAQRQAIKEAMARQKIRTARSPGAVGPFGRTVLLIAVITLVGLIAVWVLLAL